MSVIVRTPENKIMVICKGADSIIEKRLKEGQTELLSKTQEFLDDYAKKGLRTLLIAHKEIDEEFYGEWAKKHLAAATSTVNRDRELAAVYELVEFDFELLGSTAIEDKLQEDVGQTIYDIKRAGIQVWVLTGDKVETAINIGFSCRLLNNEMNIFTLQKVKPKSVKIEVNNALVQQNISKKARENGVVVAGDTLAIIQKDDEMT